MSRRKSAKERVLARWPGACCFMGYGFNSGLFVIRELGEYPWTNCYSNHFGTCRQAWADAAKRLRGKR